MNGQFPPSQLLQVAIDPDLRDLLPGYLERRKADLTRLRAALPAGDFQTMRTIGHQLKGNAASFGLEPLAALAGALEDAAEARDGTRAATAVTEMAAYLQTLGVQI